MLVTLAGLLLPIVTLLRLEQYPNAYSPMLVTLQPIATLVRRSHEANAPPRDY